MWLEVLSRCWSKCSVFWGTAHGSTETLELYPDIRSHLLTNVSFDMFSVPELIRGHFQAEHVIDGLLRQMAQNLISILKQVAKYETQTYILFKVWPGKLNYLFIHELCIFLVRFAPIPRNGVAYSA